MIKKITKIIRLFWALIIAIVLVKLGDRLLPTDPLTAITLAVLGIAIATEMFFATIRKKPKRVTKKKPQGVFSKLRILNGKND